MTIDPRNGAPKKPDPLKPHDGMHHRANGTLIAGISRTQAEHPLNSKIVTVPTVGKRLAPVQPHPAADPLRPDRGSHCGITIEDFQREAATTGSAHPLK
jgi:hypothetical protein